MKKLEEEKNGNFWGAVTASAAITGLWYCTNLLKEDVIFQKSYRLTSYDLLGPSY